MINEFAQNIIYLLFVQLPLIIVAVAMYDTFFDNLLCIDKSQSSVYMCMPRIFFSFSWLTNVDGMKDL